MKVRNGFVRIAARYLDSETSRLQQVERTVTLPGAQDDLTRPILIFGRAGSQRSQLFPLQRREDGYGREKLFKSAHASAPRKAAA